MKRKILLIIVLLLSIFSASIRHTFFSTFADGDNESTHGPYGYKSKIYAGVEWDINEILASCFFLACITAPIGIIDLPFSFVIDTLLLPYTITSKQRNKNRLERCWESKRNEASEAQKRGDRWEDDDQWCMKKY